MDPVFIQSFEDLALDFEALLFIGGSGMDRLSAFRLKLERTSDQFAHETRVLLLGALKQPLANYQFITQRLREVLRQRSDWERRETLMDLIDFKKRQTQELRTLQLISAGILSAGDWQSPSFQHTRVSQAGRKMNLIQGTVNDYQRDQHIDAEEYELAFIKEYIDEPFHLPVRVYVTASGMAAFSTVVTSLIPGVKGTSILVGTESYFENKRVLRQVFGDRVQWIQEMNIEGIKKMVEEHQPTAIFLDTLCNTETMTYLDVKSLIPLLSKTVRQPTTIVLDNSTRSISCQPLKYLPPFSKIRLIVIESLNKFYQFGFDQVTGGVMWTAGLHPDGLFSNRIHFGTNMPQVSVLAMPKPNRSLLEQRLQRLERNANFLARAIEDNLSKNKHPMLSHVVYPGLPSHPGFSWTKDEAFHGAYFVLAFKAEYANGSVYTKFLERVMREAKQAGIDMNAGTSFGFDVTRIYLTATKAQRDAQPFLRISVGTECQFEVERLRDVFLKVIENFF